MEHEAAIYEETSVTTEKWWGKCAPLRRGAFETPPLHTRRLARDVSMASGADVPSGFGGRAQAWGKAAWVRVNVP